MTATASTKRHPIRGALYGIILGLGLALMAIGRKIANLDSVVPIVLVVVGIILGILWSSFGPAKGAKSGPPEEPVAEPVPLPDVDPLTD